MPLHFKIKTLVQQTKRTPRELLEILGVTLQELLTMNQRTLSEPQPDWQKLTVDSLMTVYGIDILSLEIGAAIVTPHRKRLLAPAKKIDPRKDLLEIVMWQLLTALRLQYASSDDAKRARQCAEINYDLLLRQFTFVERGDIECAYQDAFELILDMPVSNEQEAIAQVNLFLKDFVRRLSAVFFEQLPELQITEDDIQIKQSAVSSQRFFEQEKRQQSVNSVEPQLSVVASAPGNSTLSE